MAKFAIEYKKVEVHFFVVEADSIEEADKIAQCLDPEEVNLLEYKMSTYEKIENGADMLSPSEYFKLREEK